MWSDEAGATMLHLIQQVARWARQRRLIGDVSPTPRHEAEPSEALDHDQRWALVHDLLHNDQHSVGVRVAGLFVLLYGQHTSRIAAMTVDQVIVNGHNVQVRFGEDPVTLPDPVDQLVRELLPRRGHSSHNPTERDWLFPGGSPGRPLNPTTLSARLRSIGISSIRTARNAVLLQLAAEVPTPVLADLLGISATRAARWAALSKQDWTTYTALRAQAQPRPN